MKKLLTLVFISIAVHALSQPNCNVYKMNNDDACFKACELSWEAIRHPQGSRISQEKFDEAIATCPSFDYAYFEKAVPYLKRGDFITWKVLIDKAVELNPLRHLGYRGWCRYQFLRDYRGAIADLEKLESMITYDVGYSINGDYHLNFAKALCYKAIGEKQKALKIMTDHAAHPKYNQLGFDYLHIGVLQIETGDFDAGIESLEKQLAYNDYVAETYYYLAMAQKKLGRAAQAAENLKKAQTHYLKGYRITDHYVHPMDKIYLSDIERELKAL